MQGFTSSDADGVFLWVGDPDQAAHDSLLEWLRQHCHAFLTHLPPGRARNILQGNLGEMIGFCVGHWHHLVGFSPFPANAFHPLRPISASELDIVWLRLGTTPEDDTAVLHEIKTTRRSALHIADRLVRDYDKLFGVNVAFTLHTRLQAIKNFVELQWQRPELCPRISALAGKSPKTSPAIRLLPTVVHERRGSEPHPKLLAVRTTICGRGWPPDAVSAWSISLTELASRLGRLALGQQ